MFTGLRPQRPDTSSIRTPKRCPQLKQSSGKMGQRSAAYSWGICRIPQVNTLCGTLRGQRRYIVLRRRHYRRFDMYEVFPIGVPKESGMAACVQVSYSSRSSGVQTPSRATRTPSSRLITSTKRKSRSSVIPGTGTQSGQWAFSQLSESWRGL